jgi:alpha-tubulin suppressor-like RCC1 family protein
MKYAGVALALGGVMVTACGSGGGSTSGTDGGPVMGTRDGGGSQANGMMAPLDRRETLTAGLSHDCKIRSDGTVACWGSNGTGACDAPVGRFVQISAGHGHTCGLKSDGAVACWGDNQMGQSTPPQGVFVQVSAGPRSSCAVRTSGEAVCWRRHARLLGQLDGAEHAARRHLR